MSEVNVNMPEEKLLRFHKNNELWFEAEAIELDLLLAEAQQGLDLADPSTMNVWLGRFRDLLQNHLQESSGEEQVVTTQQAFVIFNTVTLAMDDLKKTVAPMQTSQSSTTSTPTPSPEPNE